MLAGDAFLYESKKNRKQAHYQVIKLNKWGCLMQQKRRIFSKICQEKRLSRNYSIKLYNENQSAQELGLNSVFGNSSKHINVRHHFIRGTVKCKQTDLKYTPKEDMVADIFTKGLCKVKHDNCM